MSLRTPYYGGFPGPPTQENPSEEQIQVTDNSNPQRSRHNFSASSSQHFDHGVVPFYPWPHPSGYLANNQNFHYHNNRYGVPPAGVFYNHQDSAHVQQEYFPSGYVEQQYHFLPNQAQFSHQQHAQLRGVNTIPSSTDNGHHSSNADNLSGKPRRFSRQRTAKENNPGMSGEVANKAPDESEPNAFATKNKTTIRFSHQKEDVQSTKKDLRQKIKQSSSLNEMKSKVNKDYDKTGYESGAPPKTRETTSKQTFSSRGKLLKAKYKKNEKLIEDGSQAGVLLDQLSSGSYECMVCCDRIKQHHAVWNCTMCYNLFHMGCIKKWARSPAAKMDDVSLGWRCPGCQNVTQQVPNTYFCFCGKLRNPEWKKGEIPHSCGENCGKARRDHPGCTHACNILCHPGPCPQCPAMIKKFCKCGKINSLVRCCQQSSLVCSQPCGKLRNCGMHKCLEICHGVTCNFCDLMLTQECFCGKQKRDVLCGSDESNASANLSGGCYSCPEICDRLLSCGKHRCKNNCHSGSCKPCPLMPSAVKFCPCTQVKLSDMKDEDGLPVERTSCSDPIPTCGKICGKPLQCGGDEVHTCKLTCHIGECPPCLNKESEIKCRCGRSEKEVSCKEFIGMETYVCDRRCNKKRKCGRHKCGLTCCILNEHPCNQLCARKLSCAIHRCEDLCHRGPCHTCYNVSFDELRCYCGDKVIFPPVACGTKAPECSNECTRLHPCAHPIRHTCHTEENCPPCVELVKKKCNCGKVIRGNIMCHIDNVSCGTPCHKVLPCGHKCAKTCHKGTCTESEEVCAQPCSIMRSECIHPCANSCHLGKPCPQTPCKSMVTLRCPCGRREEQVECSTCIESFYSLRNAALSSSSSADRVDIEKFLRPGSAGSRTLQCNTECSIAERNRRLAAALDIKDPNLSSQPSQEYSDFLKGMARSDTAFVRTVERELSNLIENVEWMTLSKQKHSFPSMKRDKRQAIHELAEAFHCSSESNDEEPNRNVVVTATRGISKAPSPLLSDAILELDKSEKIFAGIKQSTNKGRLLSSMKFVSYKSDGSAAVKSSYHRQTDVKRASLQMRKPPSTSDESSSTAPYRPPAVRTSKMPLTIASRFDALLLSDAECSQPTTQSAKSKPTAGQRPVVDRNPSLEPKIDYFDMTD